MAENFLKKAKQQIKEALDISDLADSQQNKIVSQLLNNISLKINMAIFDKLGDEDRKKVLKFLRAKDKDAILSYLNAKIKNLPDLVKKITAETIEEFKELSGV
ncbi:MAG: hypothetical protein ABSF55_02510 [Candidatus Staskawiczbacteria bacterium]|jgi:DNA-binding GntR family transcriptional regulator